MEKQRGISILLGVALAYFARAVFVPFFLALFLAILLDPLVKALVRKKIRRQVAALSVTVFFLFGAVIMGWTISRSIMGIASELPAYSDGLREIFSGVHATSEKFEESTRILGLLGQNKNPSVIQVQVVEKYPLWMQYVMAWMGSVYDVVTVGIFVPLLLFYLLYDRDNLLESFNAVASQSFYLPKLNTDLPKIIRAFVHGNLFTGSVLVFAHAGVFYSVGLENWIPLAILTGFLNLVPLIGAPLAMILPFAQSLIQFHSAGPFIVIGLALFFFHLASNNLILPYFMSSRVNVNAVTLLLGLLFWGWIWGAIGFLLAIPMTALVKTFFESNAATHPIGNLMAARPRYVADRRRWGKSDGIAAGLTRSHADDFESIDIDEPEVSEFKRRDDGQA